MTSVDVAAVVLELKQIILGSRVRNVYQTNSKTLILKLHKSNEPTSQLLIEAGKRMHLTSYAVKKPARPPAFCMALRKHIRNGTIINIQQYEFERIVTINVKTKNGDFKLVIELFGEGNVILVNPENKILQALVYKRMRDRNVLRNEAFQHAPTSGASPLKISREEMERVRDFGKLEVVKALTRLLSIGGLYAEEILLRAQVDKKRPCGSLTKKDLDDVYLQLREVFSPLQNGEIDPRVILDREGKEVDVVPFPLKKYEGLPYKTYSSFNEALDEFYARIGVEEKVAEVSGEIEKQLAKQQRILKRQLSALEKAKREIERNRLIGDLIYTHFNELQLLLNRIMDEKRAGKSWSQLLLEIEDEKKKGKIPFSYVESVDPKLLILTVSVNQFSFSLNLRHSIQRNAARYYEKAKKAEAKLRGLERAIRETKSKIERLKLRIPEEKGKVAEKPRKLLKRAWYEKFRWFTSSDGFLVLGGRDASTNEVLVKKHMENHDVVFHADIVGAPFVLIKTEGKTPPEQTLLEAAQLAASYSRAWKMMLGAVDVYWVRPEQVSKSAPSGQFLKKGAFMIRGRKNYVRGVPLRLAIGVTFKENRPTVVGGPPTAIAKLTNLKVEIVPGEEQSSKLAKKIRWLLAERAPEKLRESILSLPLEEIQRFIPSGRGRTLP